MTKEGKVKKLVSTYLNGLKEGLESRGHTLYVTMFVPVGYGKRNTLDYTLCLFGQFVTIETKAPGEDLTPAQRLTALEVCNSGGKVFIISGMEGLNALRSWVQKHVSRHNQSVGDAGDNGALP